MSINQPLRRQKREPLQIAVAEEANLFSFVFFLSSQNVCCREYKKTMAKGTTNVVAEIGSGKLQAKGGEHNVSK